MTDLDRTGWYEFLMPGVATTHIAYVYEDGSVYLPEGPQVVSESDFLGASAEGRAHRLVRDPRAETEAELADWATEINDLKAALDAATRRAEVAEAEVKRQCAGRALEQNGLRNAVLLLGPAQEALARIEALLAEWNRIGKGDGIHGQQLRAALDGEVSP